METQDERKVMETKHSSVVIGIVEQYLYYKLKEEKEEEEAKELMKNNSGEGGLK
jgi:hypothetical protein